MAFCTNCGKALEEGARFCTNCGAAVLVAVPAPATAASMPVVAVATTAPVTESTVSTSAVREKPAPVVSETELPQAKAPELASYDVSLTASQSSMSPIFVIICVVMLVLISCGIAGTVYLQRQGKAKTQQTAASNSTSNSSTPVPVPSPATPVADSIRAMNLGSYPGATPVAVATLSGETVVAGFLTRDTPQQVMQYYKIRFPVSTMSESEGRAELSTNLPGGERIRIHAEPQGSNTQVIVLQEN
jgi:hypothetical protein